MTAPSPAPFLWQCPMCGGELSTGAALLGCPACRLEWPVVNGIPRFVSSQHLESFGRQWTKFDVAHDDEDRATFAAKTGVKLSELKGLRVLDAGCGGGRYSKVAGEAGALVVGADHTQAVDKAAALCGQLANVQFVQADLPSLSGGAGGRWGPLAACVLLRLGAP